MKSTAAYLFTWLSAIFFLVQHSDAFTCSSRYPLNLKWTVSAVDNGDTESSNSYLLIKDDSGNEVRKLHVTKCVYLSIEVTNNLVSDPLTLHFHGLLQRDGYNVMDGPQGLTQSGIKPGESFTYKVFADVEGSYWIHSHSGGQYPRGLRLPLIVTNYDQTTDTWGDNVKYGYTSEKLMTVTDWWPNFHYAEKRSLSKATTGPDKTCGTGTAGGFGIEYPSKRVLINDQHPTEKAYGISAGADQRVYTQQCGTTTRLRIVNLSSHARFYIWFTDNLAFDLIELDGISYEPRSTSILELGSGQRASILVKREGTTCRNSAIVAMSDPKISHGTTNCPMTFTQNTPSQYAHAIWKVEGATNPTPTPNNQGDLLPSVVSSNETWRTVWADNANIFPPGTTSTTSDAHYKNRLRLPYIKICWNNRDYSFKTDIELCPASQTQSVPVGVSSLSERDMVPTESVAPWLVPTPPTTGGTNIHYITLAGNADGFASMVENKKSGNGLYRWASPDTNPATPVDKKKIPQWPSMMRALQDGLSPADLTKSSTYNYQSDLNVGRTIMMSEYGSTHWFVLKSELGDHPMHLHGHHFQILAKLPPDWWNASPGELHTHIKTIWDNSNTKNPPRRDTIMVEKDVVNVIAIKADNPGVWAFHCHNDIHAASGMFSQVIEAPDALRDIVGTWKPINADNQPLKLKYTPGQRSELAQPVKDLMSLALKMYGWQASEFSWDNSLARRFVA